uniref:Uncharacterized protein n=1 Tax=Marseillevirus LCMAC101 TaxID=2506602 RepID=A0A481YQS9_9VIRU|nr:MAG: hypothetical protein LCMAC101_01660 [Marseillevirus LCMAC101]
MVEIETKSCLNQNTRSKKLSIGEEMRAHRKTIIVKKPTISLFEKQYECWGTLPGHIFCGTCDCEAFYGIDNDNSNDPRCFLCLHHRSRHSKEFTGAKKPFKKGSLERMKKDIDRRKCWFPQFFYSRENHNKK